MSKIVTLDSCIRARGSLRSRLRALRETRSWRCINRPSPIEDIGVFEEEINTVERAYIKMVDRIDSARVIFDD